MTHEEHKELLPLAALGAADEREQAALDAHLAGCGECRAELRSLADAAALLSLRPAPVAPRPELRSRLLAEIKSVPQENSSRRGAQEGAATPASGGTEVRGGSSVVSLGEARAASRGAAGVGRVGRGELAGRDEPGARGELGVGARPTASVSRPALLFGALAASIALFALASMLVVLWQRNGALRREVAQLSAALDQARSQLDTTNGELARVRFESELLAAPDSHTAALAGTQVARSARAKLVFSEATGEAILVAADLPPAPAGKAYQLWYIAEGKPPMPGSVFTTDQSGRGELRERIPPEGRRAQVFAVTLEPAGGLPAPSGEIYLKGPA